MEDPYKEKPNKNQPNILKNKEKQGEAKYMLIKKYKIHLKKWKK